MVEKTNSFLNKLAGVIVFKTTQVRIPSQHTFFFTSNTKNKLNSKSSLGSNFVFIIHFVVHE